MNKIKTIYWRATGILVLGLLAACSKQDGATAAAADATGQQTAPAAAAPVAAAPVRAPEVCTTCGVVRSITAIAQQGQGTGVGAALGAIVGGVAGNQVGGGSGRKIATVAGAVGGALLGNNIEKNRNATSYYEVVIAMEDGSQQLLTVQDASGISVGSAVTVRGDVISLR